LAAFTVLGNRHSPGFAAGQVSAFLTIYMIAKRFFGDHADLSKRD
jgi:hypothetical protein